MGLNTFGKLSVSVEKCHRNLTALIRSTTVYRMIAKYQSILLIHFSYI